MLTIIRILADKMRSSLSIFEPLRLKTTAVLSGGTVNEE